MKYFLIIFISLFIFSCSTTTTYIPETSTYTKEKAESITNIERCFGISTGVHYRDIKIIDDAGYKRLVESLRKLNPELIDPIQDICMSQDQMALTNLRISQGLKILAARKAQANEKMRRGLESYSQRQVYGSSSYSQSSSQTGSNSNNNQGYEPLRGSATGQYYNDRGKAVCTYADGHTTTSSSTRCPYNP